MQEFQTAVLGRLPTSEQLRTKITELWAEAEAAVDAAWEERWHDLAPGADVLSQTWAALGARYDKQVDGPAIAAAMDQRPQELEQLLQQFFHEQ
jgi:hypothetical protein